MRSPRPFPGFRLAQLHLVTMRNFLSPALIFLLAPSLSAQPPSAIAPPAYVEKWIAAPKEAGTYAGIFPRFRFTDHLAAAIADQDKNLVAALMPLLREANEAEITLLRLELGVATEQAAAATTLATNLDNLTRLLSERPVSGAPDQIEREAIAGAALRFHAAAATARAVLPAIARRLKGLGAPDASTLPAAPPPPQPNTDPAVLVERSPILSVLGMIAERRLSTLSALPLFTTPLEPLYVSENDFPEAAIVRLGGRDPLSTETRAALVRDDRVVVKEAIALRLDAIAALRPVVEALPEDRLRTMADTAALAERQFRQGAIPIALFLESQQGWLETLEARNDALLNLWREVLELQSLAGRSAPPVEAPNARTINQTNDSN